MGTRCLTVMFEMPQEGGREIAVLYRQFDGYPDCHGKELRDFLKNMVMTNGININETRKIANGGGCLAAQIVAYFKKEAGGFYLYPPGTRDAGAEYIYYIRPQDNGKISVSVEET